MENITSAKLILHIETNKRTIHREFKNYAELFDYGVIKLSDLAGGTSLYTHTAQEWKDRGDHCHDFSDL